MSQENTGKMGLASLTLFNVCAVLVIDTLTASASLGPSAITWWLITLVLFVVPYGLISSELATTYPGEGGIYDWVKRACGMKWAVRTTWYYWINVALWMPAVYIMFAGMFAEMFFPGMGLWPQIAICIALTALTIWICNVSVDAGVWVTNLGAIAKVIVIAVLAIGGFMYAMEHGVANEFTVASMTPNFDSALGFLPVIVFNLLGFELVACPPPVFAGFELVACPPPVFAGFELVACPPPVFAGFELVACPPPVFAGFELVGGVGIFLIELGLKV